MTCYRDFLYKYIFKLLLGLLMQSKATTLHEKHTNNKHILTGLIPPHFYACPNPGPGFLTSYVVVFFVFSELRWEVIVHFADIGEIDVITV